MKRKKKKEKEEGKGKNKLKAAAKITGAIAMGLLLNGINLPEANAEELLIRSNYEEIMETIDAETGIRIKRFLRTEVYYDTAEDLIRRESVLIDVPVPPVLS